MEVFIRNQASILLDALFIGMIIMAFYDVFRLFRRIIRHGRLIRDLEDLIFWIIAGFIVFSLVYSRNNGNIRWFIIVGVALGMYLYYVSFGRFVVKYTAKYINKLINIDKVKTNIYPAFPTDLQSMLMVSGRQMLLTLGSQLIQLQVMVLLL